jgi:hypothetical protein
MAVVCFRRDRIGLSFFKTGSVSRLDIGFSPVANEPCTLQHLAESVPT